VSRDIVDVVNDGRNLTFKRGGGDRREVADRITTDGLLDVQNCWVRLTIGVGPRSIVPTGIAGLGVISGGRVEINPSELIARCMRWSCLTPRVLTR